MPKIIKAVIMYLKIECVQVHENNFTIVSETSKFAMRRALRLVSNPKCLHSNTFTKSFSLKKSNILQVDIRKMNKHFPLSYKNNVRVVNFQTDHN